MFAIQINNTFIAWDWEVVCAPFQTYLEHWPLTKTEEIEQICVFNALYEALIIVRPQ